MTNEGGGDVGTAFWVLHLQECQRCGRLDAPLPTPEITPEENISLAVDGEHANSEEPPPRLLPAAAESFHVFIVRWERFCKPLSS